MKKINVKREIKNFNERLRVAENTYGTDSPIVKAMRDKANQLQPTWTTKDGKNYRISTKTEVDENDMRRFTKYIRENSVSEILKNKLSDEDYVKMKSLKKEARINFVKETISKTEALKAIVGQIWDEMYNAGFSPEECNDVYDAILEGKYEDTLNAFKNGDISIGDLANSILKGIDEERYGGYEEWDGETFEDL